MKKAYLSIDCVNGFSRNGDNDERERENEKDKFLCICGGMSIC